MSVSRFGGMRLDELLVGAEWCHDARERRCGHDGGASGARKRNLDGARRADPWTLDTLYKLCEPGGEVSAPLDLNVVFLDAGAASPALWSMLHLAGYLTIDDP